MAYFLGEVGRYRIPIDNEHLVHLDEEGVLGLRAQCLRPLGVQVHDQ